MWTNEQLLMSLSFFENKNKFDESKCHFPLLKNKNKFDKLICNFASLKNEDNFDDLFDKQEPAAGSEHV